jgi:hypothetical protein
MMDNKKRLTDVNALQRRICGAKCGCEYEDCGNEGDCEFDFFIFHAPIVDAVEVVHGRWKKNWCDNNMIGHEFEECSKCGCSMLDTNQFWDSNYCPNCGARMRDRERREDNV